MSTAARTRTCLVAATIVAVACGFHINPRNRTEAPNGNPLLDRISEPVHERITRQAREAFAERCRAEQGNDCDRGVNEPVIQDSLVRGVWWSDDPNQDLYQARQAEWLADLTGAGLRAKRHVTMDGRYKMVYRSHYGDMQFLHSMASADGESGSVTRDHIHMWGEFLYTVATGKLQRESHFRDVTVVGLGEYFVRQRDWELRKILQPRFFLRDNPHDFEDHALGALLHMVEDSYSAAHVERDYTATQACPVGRVVSFHSYTNQNSGKHGRADTMAAFENTKYPTGAGPVEVSAQIIWFARTGADWKTEVQPWLDQNVYCFDGELRAADAGEFR